MLVVDSHEPVQIEMLLRQSVPVTRSNINQQGMADYMWFDCSGRVVQVERKQWGEVLSDLDAVEEQLRREVGHADRTCLLIEGVAEPVPDGVRTYAYGTGKLSKMLVPKRVYGKNHPGMMAMLMSWIWQLSDIGVPVVMTLGLEATAIAVASFYKNCQKSCHSTFTRYVKPKTPAVLNPQVLMLMGVRGLGEKRAQALIGQFGSVYAVVNASAADLAQVDGIGKGVAEKVLREVGAR